MWSLKAPDLLQFEAGPTFPATRPQAPETSVLTNGNHLGFLCREVIWSDLMSKPFWLESAGQIGRGKLKSEKPVRRPSRSSDLQRMVAGRDGAWLESRMRNGISVKLFSYHFIVSLTVLFKITPHNLHLSPSPALFFCFTLAYHTLTSWILSLFTCLLSVSSN